MKIAMIGHKRIPSREGGVEIVVEELATRMVEKGHSVTVYNRKGKHVSGGKTVNLKEYKGVKIKSVPTFYSEYIPLRQYTDLIGREPNGADLPRNFSNSAKKRRRNMQMNLLYCLRERVTISKKLTAEKRFSYRTE